MMVIRRATPNDVAWLLGELRAFDQFYGAAHSLYPADLAADAIVRSLVETQPFFVAEAKDGTPMGFIAGVLTTHYFNPSLRVLQELLWWVANEHRGSSAGARLLEHFVGFGRVHADIISMTLEEKSPVSDRVLLKRGFVPQEHTYMLSITTPAAPSLS